MPNRKTFDPSERYDHSGRSVGHAKRNDLKPDISEETPDVVGANAPARREESRDRSDRSGSDKPVSGR
jgi:hypothetical protein